MQTKTFKIEEVLSAVKGVLLCDIGKVYEVLNFLTGDNLFTHQLPRAGRECMPHVFKQHPFIKTIDVSDINSENWKEKLAEIKRQHPNELTLIAIGDYQHRDPIAEAVEMMGGNPDKVIVVTPE